jgi:hypothetical protein
LKGTNDGKLNEKPKAEFDDRLNEKCKYFAALFGLDGLDGVGNIGDA